MRADEARMFSGVTFFIGYVEKGVTKEAKQFIDDYELYYQAKEGYDNIRQFLLESLMRNMVKGLLDEFLKEFKELEQDRKEREKLFGPGPLTVESMDRAIRELVKRRLDDSANSGCDPATGDIQAQE